MTATKTKTDIAKTPNDGVKSSEVNFKTAAASDTLPSVAHCCGGLLLYVKGGDIKQQKDNGIFTSRPAINTLTTVFLFMIGRSWGPHPRPRPFYIQKLPAMPENVSCTHGGQKGC